MAARVQQLLTAADDVVGAVSGDLREGLVDPLDRALGIGDHDAFLGLERRGRKAQIGLCLLALGDVEADAGHPQRLTLGVIDRVAECADPALLTRRLDDPILAGQLRVIAHCAEDAFFGRQAVIWM